MDLQDRLQSGFYRDAGSRPKKPPKSLALVASGKYKKEADKYQSEMAKYRAIERILHEQFKIDLFYYHGLDPLHIKVCKAFEIAWDERHSCGHREVAEFFETLVPLLEG